MSSSTMMVSLSHANVLWSVTETVTEPSVLRGSPVDDCGRNTFTPAVLLRDSVKSTKVASRKKMTSMRGMISMRAFFAMMGYGLTDDGIADGEEGERLARERRTGLRLLDQD